MDRFETKRMIDFTATRTFSYVETDFDYNNTLDLKEDEVTKIEDKEVSDMLDDFIECYFRTFVLPTVDLMGTELSKVNRNYQGEQLLKVLDFQTQIKELDFMIEEEMGDLLKRRKCGTFVGSDEERDCITV